MLLVVVWRLSCRWRRFHGSGAGFLGSGVRTRAARGQVGVVRAKAAWKAAASSVAQGQVAGILILRLR